MRALNYDSRETSTAGPARIEKMNETTELKRQPIRKPGQRLKHRLNHHRNLARTLDARIFQLRGKLYLVTRVPDLTVLLKKFKKLSGESIVSDPDLLAEIAFAGASDGELTVNILSSISHSIEAWQKSLDKRPLGKSSTGKSSIKERNEVARLRSRAAACFAILKRRSNAYASGFILTPEQHAAFSRLIDNHTEITQFERQLSEVVFWFSGDRAAEKFLCAITTPFENDDIEFAGIDKTLRWLETLRMLVTINGVRTVELQFRNNERFQHLLKWINSRPKSWPKIQGSLLQKLDGYIEKLTVFQKWLNDVIHRQFPTVVAAWAICDQSSADLPLADIQHERRRHQIKQLKRKAQTYCELSGSPGYKRWLKLNNEGAINYAFEDKLAVLKLLNRHKNTNDVLVVVRAADPCYIREDLDLATACRFVQQYRKFLGKDYDRICEIQTFLQSNTAVETGLAIYSWLNRFPQKVRNAEDNKTVAAIFGHAMKLAVHSKVSQSLVNQIKDWSDLKLARRNLLKTKHIGRPKFAAGCGARSTIENWAGGAFSCRSRFANKSALLRKEPKNLSF